MARSGESAGRRRRRWRLTGAGWLLLGASMSTACDVRTDRSPCSGELICSEVAEAIGERPFSSLQLTGFHYAPSTSQSAIPDREELRRSLGRVVTPSEFERRRSRRSPSSLHAAGVLRVIECILTPGRPGLPDCDAGVEILEAAVRRDPDAIAAQSDLAVAHWLRSSRSDSFPERLVALEQAALAAQGAPPCSEARFNLARILDSLSLWGRAAAIYAGYLDCQPRNEWTLQSRRRRAELGALDPNREVEQLQAELRSRVESEDTTGIEAFVRSHPQLARELAERELLIEWAMEVEVGAGGISVGLETLASALVVVSGDRTVADTLASVASGAATNDLPRRIRLYGLALPHLDRLDYEAAKPLLLAAGASLNGSTRDDCPLLEWADYYLALELYQRSDYDAAFAALERLILSTDSERYPSLVARALRIQALIYRIRGDYPAARIHYERAAGLAESSGELGVLADQQVSLALVLHTLGDRQSAWEVLAEALRLRRHLYHPVSQYRLLNAAAVMLYGEGSPVAARWFQREAVAVARRADEPVMLVEAYREMASIEEAASDFDRAVKALAESSRHAARVNSPAVARFLDLENHRRAGLVLRHVDPEAAVERLTMAIEASEAIGYRQVLPNLHLARAEVWLAMGREELARTDLLLARGHVESQTEPIDLPEHRISFSEQTRAVYERLVVLEWDRGEVERAFAAADRPRDRLLEDWLLDRGDGAARSRSTDSFDLSADRVRASLDEATALVEYALVGERALAWIFTREGLRGHELDRSPHELRASVRRLHREVRRGDGEAVDGELADLYDALIEPLDLLAPAITRVIVVPHDELGRVPFSSLLDRRRGSRLVDDVAVVISPSAAATAASRPGAGTGHPRWSALILADPTFDREVYPDLPRLEHGLDEAAAVKRVYGRGSRVLTGRQATREAFRAQATDFEVVHVASHAVASLADPLAASLVMAATPGQPTALSARDVLELDLRGVRLVVLSSCGSAAGPVVGDAGVLSLARSFLAAGARSVVATSWRIDDEEVSGVMADLHVELQRHPTVAAALRAWKLKRDPQSPAAPLDARGVFELYAPR